MTYRATLNTPAAPKGTDAQTLAVRYYANIYDRRFEGPTVQSVFDQIDTFEDTMTTRVRSYIVNDLLEGAA